MAEQKEGSKRAPDAFSPGIRGFAGSGQALFYTEDPSAEAPPARPPGQAPTDMASDGGSGVTMEPRNAATHVWVRVGFLAVIDEREITGYALSMEGFEVLLDPEAAEETSAALSQAKAGEVIDTALHIDLQGVAMVFDVQARKAEARDHEGARVQRFEFVDLGPRRTEILRRIIRAFLSGEVATVDHVLKGIDDPTIGTRTGQDGARGRKTSVLRAVFNVTIAAGVAVIAVLVIFASVFESLTVVESEYAAVTAPRVTLRAAGEGAISTDLTVGDRVVRDQFLSEQAVVGLAAERQIAEAELATLPVRSAVRDLAQARLTALELRAAEARVHAPCDCLIWWMVSSGEWLNAGDEIAVLARTDERALIVEALIPLSAARNIRTGDPVSVTTPNGDVLEGQVQAVSLEGEAGPRVGLADWLRQDQSLTSVQIRMDLSADPALLGVPLTAFVQIRHPVLSPIYDGVSNAGQWIEERINAATP